MNREMMKSTAIGRNQLAQAMITPERMSVYTLFLLNRIYSESKAKNIMGISLSNVVDCPQLLGYRIYKECSNGYLVIAYILGNFGYQPCCQSFTYTHQNKYRIETTKQPK